MSNMSIDLSKKKIKYLAIGDSISEGFNQLYNVGFPGKMTINKNNKKIISGISYPSYFANILNNIDSNILESFENFAITGTRIVDWLYFLGVDPNNYNYLNSKEQINFAQTLDLKENNPWKKRIQNQYGAFGIKNKNDFNILKQQIKKANLITINIGANDLLTQVPFSEIISWKNKITSKEELDKAFKKLYNSTLKNALILFKEIKRLNPKANIIAISYPGILPKFFTLIDAKMDEKDGYENGFSHHCVSLLNKLVVEASKKSGVHYLNVNNEEYWKKNIDRLSTVFFEIHPTTNGYKRMAYDLFFKVALSNEFYKSPIKNIQKIFPNVNKIFMDNNDVPIYNIIDFSKSTFSDEKLIELSKLNDEDFFWLDDKSEKPFLKLRRNLTTKVYVKDYAKNINENSLKRLLTIIKLNELINEEILNKAISNKKFLTFLIDAIVKSDYLDEIINQVQEKINLQYFPNGEILNPVQIDLASFEKIIISVFLDIKNILFLLQEVGKSLNKITNENLLNSFNELAKEVILNINKLDKYNNASIFLKNKLMEKISKNNQSINHHLISMLIDDLIINSGTHMVVLNLVDSYFRTIKNIKNLKNIYIFAEKYLREFLSEIDFKIIVKNIIKNNKFQKTIANILINLLEIENHSPEDEIIMKNLFKFLISKIQNKNFLINVISKLFIYTISNDNINSNTKLIDFIWDFKNNEFWNLLKNTEVKKLFFNKSETFVLADAINMIFEKTKIDGIFFNDLKNITNSKNNKKSSLWNIINIGQNLILKLSKIENLYLLISDCLYNSFSEFKKMYPKMKNENNEYYKAFYRFTILNLWVGYRLFQKDIPISIFWNTKKGISQSLPSIANQIYKLSVGIEENFAREEIVDYIYGNVSIQFGIEQISERNYLPNSLLWYIKTCDKTKIDKYSKKTKEDIIFESLRIGYWK